MPTFKSLNDLKKYVNDSAQSCMDKEVAQAIKKEFAFEYDKQVYSYPNSEMYERREDLSDEDNFVSEWDGKKLIVSNNVKPNVSLRNTALRNPSVTLSEWIEHGNIPNIFDANYYPWMEPRPVAETVRNRIQTEHIASNALKKGLKKKGIKIKDGK